MQQFGKILWWVARDGEGMIVDSLGNEFYFNASIFPECRKYKKIEGRLVTFEPSRKITHVQCATKISIVAAKDEAKVQKKLVQLQQQAKAA